MVQGQVWGQQGAPGVVATPGERTQGDVLAGHSLFPGALCASPDVQTPLGGEGPPPALHPHPLWDLLVPGAVGQPGAVTAAQRC